MIIRAIAACVIVIAQASAVMADRAADLDELARLMQFAETVEIIRIEGQNYGETLIEDMMPGIGAKSWNKTIADIYDPVSMLALVRQGFDADLSQTDLAPLLGYFRSDAGREVVRLEISARRAFVDADVEAVARQRLEALAAEQADILQQVQTLIDDSDLINLNVAGTLNSSLMFFTGFYEGLGPEAGDGATEAQMLSDVWAQEEATRADAETWLNSFMVMAYQPLPPEQLEAYAAFFRSDEGRDLNRAIFAGFDLMFEELSYKLGLTVASYMSSEPL